MKNMVARRSDDSLVESTSDIVSAYVGNNVVPIGNLNTLIENVLFALDKAARPVAAKFSTGKQKPAVSVRKSLQDDQITCLECGQGFKSMKSHLMGHHSHTPREYRKKWDLPTNYPMVAPNYAEARSQLAKDSGLGNRRNKRLPGSLGAEWLPTLT